MTQSFNKIPQIPLQHEGVSASPNTGPAAQTSSFQATFKIPNFFEQMNNSSAL